MALRVNSDECLRTFYALAACTLLLPDLDSVMMMIVKGETISRLGMRPETRNHILQRQ